MRKRQLIRVQGRRQKSPWTDSLRPGSAQTLSSGESGVSIFPGGSGDSFLCTGDPPIYRNPCGELSWGFTDIHGPSGWGGDWKQVIHWTQAYIASQQLPFDSGSQEHFFEDDWPYAESGAFVFGQAGVLENKFAGEIWNESPLGSGITTSLNSRVWNTGAVYNNSIHNYLDETNGYLPFGVRFDIRIDSIVSPLPSVASGFRRSDVVVDLEHFSDEEAEDIIPTTRTSLALELSKPSSPNSTFSVSRSGASADSKEIDYVPGRTYSVLVCVDETATRGKIWDRDLEEEPSGWDVTTGASILTDYVPGIGVHLSHLDFQPGDTESGSRVGFLFMRLNPSNNPCTTGSEGSPVLPCDDVQSSSDPGYYMDTLIAKSNYWIPASTNVSYYRQIYFDGMPVFEGTHYWLDGLKVHPVDPAIFDTTDATAEVVVN